MGARRVGKGHSSWNLKKMTSYAALLRNTVKTSIEPTAPEIKLGLKRREKRENFRLRLQRVEKMVDFLSVGSFAPTLSGKIPAGAHVFSHH